MGIRALFSDLLGWWYMLQTVEGADFCLSVVEMAPGPQVGALHGHPCTEPSPGKVLVTMANMPFSGPAFPQNLFSWVAAGDKTLHCES